MFEALEKDKNSKKRPMCSIKPCSASEVMLPEVALYINMFNLLKTEIYQGQSLQILKKAKAEDIDIEIFSFMDHTTAKLRAEKLEKSRGR